MNAQIRLNSRFLPFLVGFSALLQVLDPNRAWLTLFIGLGGAWLLAYLWARSLSRGLRLVRERRYGWTQVGDQLEERFTLINQSWLPALWVEIQDESDAPGYNVSRITGVEGAARNRWRVEEICDQRGVFHLGPTSLFSGDPLGIYSVQIQDPSTEVLMVMPPVVPLPEIEVAAGGRTGEGLPRQTLAEKTVSSSGVRPYIQGDSLRLVHWPTTARKDEFHVRTLDGAPAGDWWILLDLYQGAQAGSGWDSTIEHGIILAASLADRGSHEGKAAGLIVNGEEPVLIPPVKGSFQSLEILQALTRAVPGAYSLAALLEKGQRDIGQGSSLILITADISGAWIEKLIPLLWRGVFPTILLFDPSTFDSSAAQPGEVAAAQEALARLGLKSYLITCSLLDRPEARPGQAGRWEFRISPTGRAIAVQRPAEMPWKSIG